MTLRYGGTFFLLIALFVGFIFAENAEADIQIMIASKHFGDSPREIEHDKMQGVMPEGGRVIRYQNSDFTEFNPGLFYHSNRYYIGAFKNSQGKTSVNVGKTWRLSQSINVSTGLATGYDIAPVVPMIAGHYTTGNVRVSLTPYASKMKPIELGRVEDGEIVERYTFDSELVYGVVAAVSLVF